MYIYSNENPDGNHIPDCVTRAITKALGMNYYDVVSMLKYNANYLQCDCLNVRCYEKLLDYDLNLPHYIGDDSTASEIANDFPNDILLLRMEGHLSCAMYGDIYDIWDCSDEIITDFWVIRDNI